MENTGTISKATEWHPWPLPDMCRLATAMLHRRRNNQWRHWVLHVGAIVSTDVIVVPCTLWQRLGGETGTELHLRGSHALLGQTASLLIVIRDF